MKVLFLTNQLDMGGIEKNLVRLTRELVSRGHEVWAASNGGNLVGELEATGGRHLDLGFTRGPVGLLRATYRLSRVVVLERPEIVHNFSASGAVVWALTKGFLWLTGRRRYTVPLVASVMGLQNSPDESPLLIRLRLLLTSLGARRIVVMAPAIGKALRGLPLDEERLVEMSVVGVEVPGNLDEIDHKRITTREELGVGEAEKIIVTIGSLKPSKSHELFVDAANIVLEERSDVRFLIVGDGPLRSDLEEQIARSGRSPSILLLGERDDVDHLLAACDVCVRPGVVEGFIGITVLEAQAIGRPVISFDGEDVRLAIVDGRTGRLVKNGDAVALAAAIDELLADEEKAHMLAVEGRKLVEGKYSIPMIVESLIALYRGVIAPQAGVSS